MPSGQMWKLRQRVDGVPGRVTPPAAEPPFWRLDSNSVPCPRATVLGPKAGRKGHPSSHTGGKRRKGRVIFSWERGPVPARWSVVFSNLIRSVAQFRVGSEAGVQHGLQWTPGSQLELRFGGQQARQSHRSSPEPAVVSPGPRACPRHAQLPP